MAELHRRPDAPTHADTGTDTARGAGPDHPPSPDSPAAERGARADRADADRGAPADRPGVGGGSVFAADREKRPASVRDEASAAENGTRADRRPAVQAAPVERLAADRRTDSAPDRGTLGNGDAERQAPGRQRTFTDRRTAPDAGDPPPRDPRLPRHTRADPVAMTRDQARARRDTTSVEREPERAAPTDRAPSPDRPRDAGTRSPDVQRHTDTTGDPTEGDHRVDDVMKAFHQLSDKVDGLDSKVETLSKENADLKRDNADLREVKEAMSREVADLRREMAEMKQEQKSRFDTFKRQLDKLTDSVRGRKQDHPDQAPDRPAADATSSGAPNDVADADEAMNAAPSVERVSAGAKYKDRLRTAVADASFGMAGAASAYAALGPKGVAYALGIAAATGPAARSMHSLIKTWREGRSGHRPED